MAEVPMQIGALWRAAIAKATDEDGDIRTLTAAVSMQLVENDKVQIL